MLSATIIYSLTKAEKIRITITGDQGKLLKLFITNQQQNTGNQQLDLNLPAGLPKGNYYIVISNGARQFTVKLVK